MLPFLSGSKISTFDFGHAHKAKVLFLFLFLFFPLVVGLSLDFIYIVKVSLKTKKKVNLFNKKWQVVGRPDFLSSLPVKSDRFFACNSDSIYEISLVWAL